MIRPGGFGFAAPDWSQYATCLNGGRSMGAIAGVPQPFPYQGSKRLLAEHVLSWLPDDFDRLVEPFAGSAAISLAVAKTGRTRRFLISDANKPLIDLWKAIVETPEELASKYEALWNEQRGKERTYFDQIRDCFNNTHRPEHFLYLLARCVKAAIRYNSKGQFNNSPDNRRVGMRPDKMRANLVACSRLLKGRATFTHSDYRDVLKQSRGRDIVYMDPPYQGVCGRRDARYAMQTTFGGFADTLAELNGRNVPFIVSYDGRRGDKTYGQELPDSLKLRKLEVEVGPSTTASLLGRNETTYESLYLSPALLNAVGGKAVPVDTKQASLFEYA
jgi:DNA adenine methylase